MKALLKQAAQSPFLRSVTVLTTGSFIGLLIPLILLPVFTRIYSAELFGIQGILQAGMMILVPLATGYFDWAIPTPKQASDARALAALATLLTLLVSLLTLVIVFCIKDHLIAWLNIPEIGGWIFSYPLIALTVALANIANYWLLRAGKFGAQGTVKIVASVATAVLAYTAYLMEISDGLLVGFVGGFAVGALWGLVLMFRNGFHIVMPSLALARRYRHFPLFGSIPTAIYNLACQLPLLIITATYSLHLAGHYAVMRNILFVGVSLMALCVGQVLLKHIAGLTHDKKPVWPYFLRIAGWLCVFGLALMASVYIVGPWFFQLYLGAGWEDAAEITRALAIATFFWLIGPTLAQAAVAVHKIRAVAAWQILYGLAAPCLFLLADVPFETFLWRYVAFDVIAYSIYAVMMVITMHRYDRGA